MPKCVCVCVILMDMHLHRYMMYAKHSEQQILLDKFTSTKSNVKEKLDQSAKNGVFFHI